MTQFIELLSPTKAPQLVPLFDVVWPEQSYHREDVEWAFRTSPLGEGLLLVAQASDTSLIVGARGSVPWPLRQANGALPKVHQFHGTCVHPDYRRLGLFTQLTAAFLTQFAASDGDAVFNISVAASRAGYEKLGWSYLPGLRRYLYIAEPVAFAQVMLRNQGRMRTTLKPVYRRNQPLTAWADLEGLVDVREQALADTHHTVVNEAWLNWRYSHGEQGYRFVYQPGIGWCSYRIRRSDQLTEALLGDVWLAKASYANVRSLLKTVIQAETPTVVSIVLTKAHPWRNAFTRAGFLPDWKGDLNFGVRIVRDTASNLLDPGRWSLMTADIDTF